MRRFCIVVLAVLFAQAFVSPLVANEECAIQEPSHAGDDCSPLCVTCACVVAHAFEGETTPSLSADQTPHARSLPPQASLADGPSFDILHVPLRPSLT